MADFQRRHYERIAAIINDPIIEQFTYPRPFIADRLADMFMADNPRFDRARFLRACGIDA